MAHAQKSMVPNLFIKDRTINIHYIYIFKNNKQQKRSILTIN